MIRAIYEIYLDKRQRINREGNGGIDSGSGAYINLRKECLSERMKKTGPVRSREKTCRAVSP